MDSNQIKRIKAEAVAVRECNRLNPTDEWNCLQCKHGQKPDNALPCCACVNGSMFSFFADDTIALADECLRLQKYELFCAGVELPEKYSGGLMEVLSILRTVTNFIKPEAMIIRAQCEELLTKYGRI